MIVKVPDRIASLSVYVPGKPIEAVAREYALRPESIAKLASNENPLGAPRVVRERLASCLNDLHIYPDGAALGLRTRLARKFDLSPEWVVVGNGSAELIEIAVRAYLDHGEHLICSQYAFSIAKIATEASNHEAIEIPAGPDYGHDLNAILKAINEKTKIIYVANPNNPTGSLITARELDAFIAQVPERVLVVIDEAYYEYICNADFPNSLKYVAQDGRKNVIVLRTFSKIYGLAALRVGYGFAHPEVIQGLEKVRSPFNTNALGQMAATWALDCDEHVRDSAHLANIEREFLREGLRRLRLPVYGVAGNFLAVDLGCDGRMVFDKLQARGVIIRPLAGYGLPTFIRVSTGRRTEDEKFLVELERVLREI